MQSPTSPPILPSVANKALGPWPAEPPEKNSLWLNSSQIHRHFSQHSRHCRCFQCLLLTAGRLSERCHKCHSVFDGPSCRSMPICSIPPSSHLTPIYSSIRPSFLSSTSLSVIHPLVTRLYLLLLSLPLFFVVSFRPSSPPQQNKTPLQFFTVCLKSLLI